MIHENYLHPSNGEIVIEGREHTIKPLQKMSEEQAIKQVAEAFQKLGATEKQALLANSS